MGLAIPEERNLAVTTPARLVPVVVVLGLWHGLATASTPSEVVMLSVTSASVGVAVHGHSRGVLTEQVEEPDGSRLDLAWNLETVSPESAMQFSDCLKVLRQQAVYGFDEEDGHASLQERSARCASTNGVPAATVQAQPGSTDYLVGVGVSRKKGYLGDTPGFRIAAEDSGGLGARVHVGKPDARYEQVVQVAINCRQDAAAKGITSRSKMESQPDSGGWSMGTQFETIQPFVERFVACFQGKGYQATVVP